MGRPMMSTSHLYSLASSRVRSDMSRLKLLSAIFSWYLLSFRTRRFPAEMTLPFCFHMTTYFPRLLTVQVNLALCPASTLNTLPTVTISGNISPLDTDCSLLLTIYLKLSLWLWWCRVLPDDKLALRKERVLWSVEWEKRFVSKLVCVRFLFLNASILTLYKSIWQPKTNSHIRNLKLREKMQLFLFFLILQHLEHEKLTNEPLLKVHYLILFFSKFKVVT